MMLYGVMVFALIAQFNQHFRHINYLRSTKEGSNDATNESQNQANQTFEHSHHNQGESWLKQSHDRQDTRQEKEQQHTQREKRKEKDFHDQLYPYDVAVSITNRTIAHGKNPLTV